MENTNTDKVAHHAWLPHDFGLGRILPGDYWLVSNQWPAYGDDGSETIVTVIAHVRVTEGENYGEWFCPGKLGLDLNDRYETLSLQTINGAQLGADEIDAYQTSDWVLFPDYVAKSHKEALLAVKMFDLYELGAA